LKYLVVGLGNVGQEYELTRHNIGFAVVERLAELFGVSFSSDRLALVTHFKLKSRSITLIKPTLYMNNSGKAVLYWLNFLKIKDNNYIVVTDDVALPFGKMRIKPQGSSGGHNGLKSIEQHLNSTIYPRIRMGIGNEFAKGQQSDFVLGRFNQEEIALLPAYIEKAGNSILAFCTMGISNTMNQYNT
jgi:PTH1 family peptidyl-tRNA hydrolase